MSDNTVSSTFHAINSFDEEGDKKWIGEEIQGFADGIVSHKFLEFVRLLLGVPDRIIDKILRQNLTKEELYQILRHSHDTSREQFIETVRKNKRRLNFHLYMKMDRCIRRDRNEIPENLLVEIIYELIKAIPIRDRRNFAENEIGVRNLEHRDIRNVQITSDLKLHFLEWWWEFIGKSVQNSLTELKKKAKDGGYLKNQSDVLIREQYFE
ncbi:uncharacterized protein LOC120348251 [Styela clava]